MTEIGSTEEDNGIQQLKDVLEEYQQFQQTNFSALAEIFGSNLTHFEENIITIKNFENFV